MPKCKLLTFMHMSTDSINLELKEVELEGADWICVAQDRDHLLACMDMKMKLWLHKTCLKNYQQHKNKSDACA